MELPLSRTLSESDEVRDKVRDKGYNRSVTKKSAV